MPPIDILVNAGDGQYVDPNGFTWLADKAYAPASWGYTGGSAYCIAQPIAGTDLDTNLPVRALLGERPAATSSTCPTATYRVELKFAEMFYSYAGARRFNVSIEGTTVLSNCRCLCRSRRAMDSHRPSVHRARQRRATQRRLQRRRQRRQGQRPARDTPGPADGTATASPTATQTSPLPSATATRTATRTATATATGIAANTATATRTATATLAHGDATATATTVPAYSVRSTPATASTPTRWALSGRLTAPTPAGAWGAVGGQTYSVGNAIIGTMDDTLYQSERFGMSEYRFDVPNGDYAVDLRFAEIY